MKLAIYQIDGIIFQLLNIIPDIYMSAIESDSSGEIKTVFIWKSAPKKAD